MTWLVFAASVLLTLAGAVSVMSGAPIVQIERGWTEVIAGTVAVSGGVVTFALGVVLLRLQALTKAALRVGERMSPAADQAAPASAAAADQPPGPAALADLATDTLPPAIEADDDAAPKLWRPIGSQSEPAPEEEPVAVVLETPALPLPSADEADERSAVSPTPPPSELDDRPERRTVTAPSEGERRPRLAARDWLTRPLLRSRTAMPAPDEPPPLYDSPEPSSPLEAPPVAPPIALGREPRDAAPAVELRPSLDVAGSDDENRPEITVIGRYQAGASTYTMYSDGSIDVATQTGDVHHFGSMDELKAFIARQETALS